MRIVGILYSREAALEWVWRRMPAEFCGEGPPPDLARSLSGIACRSLSIGNHAVWDLWPCAAGKGHVPFTSPSQGLAGGRAERHRGGAAFVMIVLPAWTILWYLARSYLIGWK